MDLAEQGVLWLAIISVPRRGVLRGDALKRGGRRENVAAEDGRLRRQR